MSFFFLMIFIADIYGDANAVVDGLAFCNTWALFSIADALWMSFVFKK